MEIKKESLAKIVKYSLYGGIFALIASFCTYSVYLFSAEEIEFFERFEASRTLNIWLKNNFGTISSTLNRIALIISVLIMAFLGYISSAFTLAFIDATKQVIKEEIINK